MDSSKLKEYIENCDIDKAINSITEIGKTKNVEAVPMLIEYLQSTDNSNIRNEISIALSDIGDAKAIEPIINMIKHPKTLGDRGTLLYALESFDYSEYVELIVDLLKDNSFEVSRQSLILIESIAKDIPEETRQKCVIKIKNEIENLQDKIDFLNEALHTMELGE